MAVQKVATQVIEDAAVTDAKIATGIDATKLTGSIADARIPAGAVTQHVDLTAVRQDIAMLALYNAVSDNRAAYNLPYSFIDQFEDNTGTTTRTDVGRDTSGEYFASVYSSAGPFTSDVNTMLLLHMDDTSLIDSSSGSHTTSLVGDVTRSATQSKFGSYSAYFDGSGDVIKLPIHQDFYFGTGTWTIEGWFYPTSLPGDEQHIAIYTSSSSHTSGWNHPNSDGAFVLLIKGNGRGAVRHSATGAAHNGSTTGAVGINGWYHIAYTHASGSSDVKFWVNGTLIDTIALGGSRTFGVNSGGTLTGQPAFGTYDFYGSTYRDPYAGYLEEFRISNIERYTTTFTPNETAATSATGTLISDTQTAPAAITKMSGVILLKDGGSSTTTLGTHLTISFSATNGTGDDWVNAASYTAVTAPFSTGVTMIKLGETTVPSGTSPTIRAVWASQTDGGYESQLHGWAMNY